MVKKTGQATHVHRLPRTVASDPVHETANAIHSAAVRLLRRARTADTRMDLDGPRASALSVLVYAGELPIGRLAAAEQVSPPAITKTVTALEADGLVERIRSDSDRRVVVVRATAAGRTLMERGRAARIEAIATLLTSLPSRDQILLQRAADILLNL
jgi:DNA-binding MarR family transcriptional regulator